MNSAVDLLGSRTAPAAHHRIVDARNLKAAVVRHSFGLKDLRGLVQSAQVAEVGPCDLRLLDVPHYLPVAVRAQIGLFHD